MSTFERTCFNSGCGTGRPVHRSDIAVSRASVSFRTLSDDCVNTVEWSDATQVARYQCAPWRTFRWWYGQRHYSGKYWSATMRKHVIYESRLELARLIYADYDRKVTSIEAQPFLIEAEVNGQPRRHVPDFLLHTLTGPIVVDVKPLDRINDDKVAHTLGWTHQFVDGLGWDYEVWTEPPAADLANLRFLAGYRNDRYLNSKVLEELRSARLHELTVGEAIAEHSAWPETIVRAALCHLLWLQTVQTDLTAPLQSTSILGKDVG